MTAYPKMTAEERKAEYAEVTREYEELKARGLNLNMARGKPGKAQLDLVSDIFSLMQKPEDYVSDGVDVRNYGELSGLPAAKRLFAEILGCRPEQVFVGGVLEHIEMAGIHSGDSISVYPPQNLKQKIKGTIVDYTGRLARALNVVGLMNIQFVVYNNEVFIIEVNPRSSRTVPYISKVTGVPMVELAVRCMLGEKLRDMGYGTGLYPTGDYCAVKVPVFSFEKLHDVDTQLGPEMKSTGEVMGFDRDFPHAFAKSQLAAYDGGLPTSGNVFISVNDTDKRQLPLFAARLVELGFNIWATEGTASVLRRYGIESKIVDKISVRMDSNPDDPITTYHAEGSVGKNVVQLIEEGAIDLILNTPNSRGSRSDGYAIRSAAIAADLPQFTTMTEFSAVLMAIEAVRNNDYQIMSIQDHSQQLFELESRE